MSKCPVGEIVKIYPLFELNLYYNSLNQVFMFTIDDLNNFLKQTEDKPVDYSSANELVQFLVKSEKRSFRSVRSTIDNQYISMLMDRHQKDIHSLCNQFGYTQNNLTKYGFLSIKAIELAKKDMKAYRPTLPIPYNNKFINHLFSNRKNLIEHEFNLKNIKTFVDIKFRCFKTNSECSKQIMKDDKTVFIGMPYSKECEEVYKWGVLPVLKELNLKQLKADEKKWNGDIMCKVCHLIQSCEFAIINITTWNPNVLFELGLIYGLGKKAILIRDTNEKDKVDLKNMAYAKYDIMNGIDYDFDGDEGAIKHYLEFRKELKGYIDNI